MKSILGLILAPFHGVAALAGSFAKASFGMRLAVVTALFLTVVFVLATAALLFAGEWALLQLWWSPTKIIAFLLLLVLAPLLVYQTVRLWSDPHVTRWPDIAQAWVAIGRDIERQGIRIAETPLFLVFGKHTFNSRDFFGPVVSCICQCNFCPATFMDAGKVL